MANCLFVHNAAVDAGGAVYFSGAGTLTISSCTFFGNTARTGNSLACLEPSRGWIPLATLANTILWGGDNEIGIAEHVRVDAMYSNIQGGWPGEGNIDADPLFTNPIRFDPNAAIDASSGPLIFGDYHLKSQGGRWDPNSRSWVIDDVTSPCVDAGDPNSPIGDEPQPNGGRINMGAYGGTKEASKSWSAEALLVQVKRYSSRR